MIFSSAFFTDKPLGQGFILAQTFLTRASQDIFSTSSCYATDPFSSWPMAFHGIQCAMDSQPLQDPSALLICLQVRSKTLGSLAAYAMLGLDVAAMSRSIHFDLIEQLDLIDSDFSTRRIARWLAVRQAFAPLIAPLAGSRLLLQSDIMSVPRQECSGPFRILAITEPSASGPQLGFECIAKRMDIAMGELNAFGATPLIMPTMSSPNSPLNFPLTDAHVLGAQFYQQLCAERERLNIELGTPQAPLHAEPLAHGLRI
jgi:hypothetical protein